YTTLFRASFSRTAAQSLSPFRIGELFQAENEVPPQPGPQVFAHFHCQRRAITGQHQRKGVTSCCTFAPAIVNCEESGLSGSIKELYVVHRHQRYAEGVGGGNPLQRAGV